MSDRTYGSGQAAHVRLEVMTGSGMSAVAEQGGVDVTLYRVPRPLEFLARQRNLRRVSVDGVLADDGLANTLRHVWDRWVRAVRLAWRAVFTADARTEVVRQTPELAVKPGFTASTHFRQPSQFRPLPGFELVTRFRYPVHRALPMAPPKGLSLAGSSSEFIPTSDGNVLIPIGTLSPGLYLVEVALGGFRATTLVFASDTIAITKTSAREILIWTADRASGSPVRGARVHWTDGVGALRSGTTDALGLARLSREVPERSYVIGEDRAGGVFISENFYFDSEIYDTKLYPVTDRPLYRPGDEVFVKVFGREFQSARQSRAVAPAQARLVAFDPAGLPVTSMPLAISADTGGETSFRLPEEATAGGYELRVLYRDAQYAAAFRVAEYQKPHFEIALVPDKPDFKVGEPVTGRLQLHYPDGSPVRNAEIQLTARSQQLTTVDGELRYYGQFPVKLETETLVSDTRGEAAIVLPAADEPSRYLLTALATDGASYRVRTTRELLIERAQGALALAAGVQFSQPGDSVTFAVRPVGTVTATPVTWEWIRQDDRARAQGTVTRADAVDVRFPVGGSYTVRLRDARGNVVAAVPHWVAGGSTPPPVGTIRIVPSQEKYRIGDTAELLITFPEPVDDALITLERDNVEQATTLRRGGPWVSLRRASATEWRARLPVRSTFAPNVTVSVAYVKRGEYVFQNQGLVVTQPSVSVAVRSDKPVYRPGERVELTLTTAIGATPVAAVLAVGVVDEMVFALQPEVAPSILDFFYHPRRNNVRTAASQDFMSYDLAAPRLKQASVPRAVAERAVKVLERPRRDDKDTAFWQPTVRTDASGQARVSFTMPDALTRWRVTARAMTADGTVGQHVAHVRSDQEIYLTWTSPTWLRTGDAPTATIAVFNQTPAAQAIQIEVAAPGISARRQLSVPPGASYVPQSLAGLAGSGAVTVTATRNGQVADRLETPVEVRPAQAVVPRTLAVTVGQGAARLDLPPDARRITVGFGPPSAAFGQVLDDLLAPRYRSLDGTASRVIALALAIDALPASEARVRDRLVQQLASMRLALAYVASPNGLFTWWGHALREDAFLTGYAYYADWYASRTLRIDLPEGHWERLLELYRDRGASLPLLQRALLLHVMQEMRLPVRSLVEGLVADVQRGTPRVWPAGRLVAAADSLVVGDPGSQVANAAAAIVADRLARREALTLPAAWALLADAAADVLRTAGQPAADALLLAGAQPGGADVPQVLASLTGDGPAIERALALTWVRNAAPSVTLTSEPTLPAPWTRAVSETGAVVWRWPTGVSPPAQLQVQGAPAGVRATVRFEATAVDAPRASTRIERQLYRVVKRENAYELRSVPEGQALSTNELYLDEVTVVPGTAAVEYALVDVPLPPGASVESTTWGVGFRTAGSDELTGLERARHETTRSGYAVPVDGIGEPVRFRHLVRFAARGTFGVPRARLTKVYAASGAAVEPGRTARRIEVR